MRNLWELHGIVGEAVSDFYGTRSQKVNSPPWQHLAATAMHLDIALGTTTASTKKIALLKPHKWY